MSYNELEEPGDHFPLVSLATVHVIGKAFSWL
ncbi:Uncharacterised protein [Mycobacteroides abscessus subsp. abscessus]|nr:Uncharacterised protein [Mycobacteroides abscessus subsp. abscessus]